MPGIFSAEVRGWMLTMALRLGRWTWRLHVEDPETIKELYDRSEPFILCFWHGKYIPILPVLEGYQARVFTSVSKRGDVIARICHNFGYRCTQIPDHGGEKSLRMMESIISESTAGLPGSHAPWSRWTSGPLPWLGEGIGLHPAGGGEGGA